MMTAMESEAIAGPRTALEDLHRGHYRSLVRLASLLVDDVATCEELVQDAFVAVFRKPGLVRDQDKLPAYLRSAVLNGARSHLRARQVRDRAQPLRVAREPDSPEAGAVMADDQRAVLDALRDLPDRQRDALVLRFYLDLSEAQIAETLGIKAGTVKTHVRRGLEALATTLEDRR
jgi:RNA polymerase sigma-70 factor (sigma-E family)